MTFSSSLQCGCALRADGSPCVAHLVCAIPIVPFKSSIPSNLYKLGLKNFEISLHIRGIGSSGNSNGAILELSRYHFIHSRIYNKERNLIGFPLSTNNGRDYKDKFAIIKIDLENGLSIYGEIEEKANKYDRDIKRTIYIGEKLYTLTYSTISSYNINTLEKVSSIELEK